MQTDFLSRCVEKWVDWLEGEGTACKEIHTWVAALLVELGVMARVSPCSAWSGRHASRRGGCPHVSPDFLSWDLCDNLCFTFADWYLPICWIRFLFKSIFSPTFNLFGINIFEGKKKPRECKCVTEECSNETDGETASCFSTRHYKLNPSRVLVVWKTETCGRMLHYIHYFQESIFISTLPKHMCERLLC